MGAFGGLIQTNKGRNLQAKAEAGAQLKFTRMGVGDGQLGGQSIPSLNKLIHETMSLPITRLKPQLPAQAIVGAVLSNQDVTTGFFFRELGIFAQDPDEGEILYAYGNSGSGAEYIPPAGTADIIEKTIDMIVTFGQAQNVSAVINSSLIFATPDDVETALEEAKQYTDTAVAGVKVPDASLTQKGITQLSSATDSTSEAMAATPKAVKAAYDRGSAGVTAAAAAQAKADAAETPAGAQAKANAAETNAKNYVNLNTVRIMGGLPQGSDLNNVVTSGIYQMREASAYTNIPSNMDWSVLEVATPGAYIIQTLTSVTSQLRMFRTRTESNWSTWRKILQQSDYDALFQSVANGKQAIATAISGKGVAASGSDEFAVLANKVSQIKTETPSGSVYVDFSQQDYMVWANTTQRYKIADIPAGVKMISFEYVSSVSDGIYLKVEQPMSAYVCILNVVLRDANGMEIEVLNESRSTYGGRYYPRFLLNLVTNNRTYSSLPDDIFPRPNPSMGRFDISTSGFDRSRPMVLEIKAQNPSPNDNTMRVTHMVRGTVSYA